MKKVISLILICFLITGCTSPQKKTAEATAKSDFTRGVWLSFNEINSLIFSENGLENEILKAAENFQSLKITDLYLHIRSHCDSIINSQYFPQTEASKTVGFDILQRFIEVCHDKNIRVHAWINPYRVSATEKDTSVLPPESPVVKRLSDESSENDKNVVTSTGIYLNPAEEEVRQLIVNGIREILDNYQVDGIHFDDYFYPTTEPQFDEVSYKSYTEAVDYPLKLEAWRRANVDALIADCNTAIEMYERDIIFSISPAASIEKNYNTHYADINGWVNSNLIDQIIPQLYFGFEHTDPQFCFEKLLNDWLKLCAECKTELKIGLAPYKIGTQSPTDGTEWENNEDIISRQTKICAQNNKISGVCYFSYSSLFSDQPQNTAERNNLLNIL